MECACCHVSHIQYYIRRVERETEREGRGRHAGFTPSIAFRHLPPNSCRISYATEGALFISAQLSERVRVLIKLQTLVYDRGRCRKAVLGVWVLI